MNANTPTKIIDPKSKRRCGVFDLRQLGAINQNLNSSLRKRFIDQFCNGCLTRTTGCFDQNFDESIHELSLDAGDNAGMVNHSQTRKFTNMAAAKQPNERYRLKGRTRYIGVQGWERDEDAKRIAKLARQQGIKVMAQYDLAQNQTFLYVPESRYAHDTSVIRTIEQQEGIEATA